MSREGYREEPAPLDAERPSAATEMIDEGREDLETRLDASRRNLAAAEYAYQQALKEAGVSRRERRGLDGGGEGASKRKLWSGRESEAAEELAGREFPHLLDRYRSAKAAYEENKSFSQRERVEGGPSRQEGMAQALEFRLEEKRHLQNAQYEARPKKERGLLWKTGAAVFRSFQALNEKINKLPPAARWAANVARWGAAGAVGGVGVVYGLPMIGVGLGAAGLGAGATIGMRVGRSIFGGLTGALAADLTDRVAEKYMDFRGLTREQLQEEIKTVSRTYEEEGNIDALEKFLAEKGAELEEQYARMERAQKIAGYGKIAAAVIGGGVGGYFGYERLRLGQIFSGVAEAQTPVSPRTLGPGQADPLQKSAAGPQAPLTKEALDQRITESAGKIEKELLQRLENDPSIQVTFKDDLARFKELDWTQKGTQQEVKQAWAKWKAGHAARAAYSEDLKTLGSVPATSVPRPPGAQPPAPRAIPPPEAAPLAPKPLFEQSIVNRARVGEAQGVENSFANQIKADPKAFGFDDDLKRYKGKSAWAKAATPEAIREEWAKWKAHRMALETGIVQKGKQLLVLNQTKSGWKNPSYVLEMQPDGKPKVTVVLEDNKGAYKNVGFYTPDQKWSGKPMPVYEYASEPDKPRSQAKLGTADPGARTRPQGTPPEKATTKAQDPPGSRQTKGAELPPGARVDASALWGPETAPRPEGAGAADPFGNEWRVVGHTAGTDKVWYETDIKRLPNNLKDLLPQGADLVAGTDSPGGPYEYFGLYDVPPGEKNGTLILRLSSGDLPRTLDQISVLEHAVRAARERVGFIDAFTERNDWDRAVTVNLVKNLEMGRSSRIFMDFAKPDNVIPERIIFEVAPSRNGILLSMPMPDHRSPFSGEHFQSVAGKRIEDLMDLSKKAGALASVRDQARILSETIQSYAFDRKWDDVMKLNLRAIEIQAQEWQSHSDTSTWYTSKSQGAFAGWLLEQAEALKRQGVKLTPQTKVGTILGAIARERA